MLQELKPIRFRLCSIPPIPLSIPCALWLKGHIELMSYSESGDEACIAMLGPNSWLTWIGCFDEQPTNHNFYSSSDAIVVAIPVKKMRDIADRYQNSIKLQFVKSAFRFRQWSGRPRICTA
ncbi:cyclic nucleotide-binding domain-containing protein [Vibrio lentus]|nr:cyclic nucleotide-binding domain-containing protein [Vibrio lentus]